MKWVRRALVILLAIPAVAVAALVVAGQREGAGHVQAQVEIPRPAADVFPHLVEPELLQRWAGLSEVELAGDPPLRVGSRARTVVVARGRRLELSSEVTALERDKLVVFELATTGEAAVHFTQVSRYTLEERGGRTLVTAAADTVYQGVVPRLLEPLLTGAAQRLLEQRLGQLEAQVEAGVASHSR